MKMWKNAAMITLSLSIVMISGYAFARHGGYNSGKRMYQERSVTVDTNRYGRGYYHQQRPRTREYRPTYVARDRNWRRGVDSYRYFHKPLHYRRPFVSIGFTSPLQFVYPRTNYLYMYGVQFR